MVCILILTLGKIIKNDVLEETMLQIAASYFDGEAMTDVFWKFIDLAYNIHIDQESEAEAEHIIETHPGY